MPAQAEPILNGNIMAEQILVIFKNISELNSYEKNSRTHSPEQLDQIAASIQEFGWTNPVLIDENNEIIAGHGRCAAAEKIGIEQVPTIQLAGLSEAQKRAYRIADNKLPMNAGWDEELLKAELSTLMDEGYSITLTGFNDDELSQMLSGEGVDIDFDDDEDSTGVDIDYLTFCRKKIPLSETESAALMMALESFIEKNGSMFGFASSLLGGENA